MDPGFRRVDVRVQAVAILSRCRSGGTGSSVRLYLKMKYQIKIHKSNDEVKKCMKESVYFELKSMFFYNGETIKEKNFKAEEY